MTTTGTLRSLELLKQRRDELDEQLRAANCLIHQIEAIKAVNYRECVGLQMAAGHCIAGDWLLLEVLSHGSAKAVELREIQLQTLLTRRDEPARGDDQQ